MFITNGEIYLGFMLIVFTYLRIIILAASSVSGDLSLTVIEIKERIKAQAKPLHFDYLPYHEQLAELEKRRKQGIKDRKRQRAERKAKTGRARRLYRHTDNNNTSFDAWDDDLTSTNSTSSLFDNDDDFFIDNDISDAFEMPISNISTGLPMLSNSCVDVGGHMWGENNSFDSSINDTFDSNDCFSFNMDEY